MPEDFDLDDDLTETDDDDNALEHAIEGIRRRDAIRRNQERAKDEPIPESEPGPTDPTSLMGEASHWPVAEQVKLRERITAFAEAQRAAPTVTAQSAWERLTPEQVGILQAKEKARITGQVTRDFDAALAEQTNAVRQLVDPEAIAAASRRVLDLRTRRDAIVNDRIYKRLAEKQRQRFHVALEQAAGVAFPGAVPEYKHEPTAPVIPEKRVYTQAEFQTIMRTDPERGNRIMAGEGQVRWNNTQPAQTEIWRS